MSTVEEFDSPTGKGATGKIDGKNRSAGHSNFLKSARYRYRAARRTS